MPGLLERDAGEGDISPDLVRVCSHLRRGMLLNKLCYLLKRNDSVGVNDLSLKLF